MANKIDIPDGWEVKKLGEVGNFLKGKGIKKDELCDNGLPCVIYGQIYTSYDFYTEKFTSFIPVNLKPYTTEVYQNDILFAGSGETKEEIGKSIAYIGKEYAYAGGDIIILRQDKVISIFITYYLNSIGRKQLNRLGQGDSVVHIYKSILESVKIPVPPLAEQEKIAEILSLWDKAIEQTKELIVYKEKQKKGLMQNLLTGKKRLHGFTDEWKTVKLGEVCEYQNGDSNEENIINNGNYSLITLNSIDINGRLKKEHKRINQGKPILYKNDIVMILSDIAHGFLLGLSAVINENDKYILNQRVGLLRPQKQINSLFLSYLINLNQSYFKKHGQGSSQLNLSKGDIINFQLYIPLNIEEQNFIVKTISKADEEIELLKKQLDLYTEQKKGLMQNLLTGKIRVTV